MIKRLKISTKLIINFLISALVAISIVGAFSFYHFNSLLNKSVEERLELMKIEKKIIIENYFIEKLTQAKSIAQSRQVYQILNLLNQYQDSIGISSNSSFIFNTQRWDEIINQNQIQFVNILDIYQCTDLLIINKEGQIIFTYLKQSELGENLTTGKLRKTTIARIWDKIAKTGKPTITDFSYRKSLDNQQYAFAGAAIKNDLNEINGFVLLQFSPQAISEMMTTGKFFGESDEVVVFGDDYLFKSNSRLMPKDAIAETIFENEAAKQALDGKEGIITTSDYRNKGVIISYSPLLINGLNWGIASKIDVSEAKKQIIQSRITFGIIALIILIIVSIQALMFTQRFLKPVYQVAQIINQLGKGEHPRTSLTITTQDEMGVILNGVNSLVDGLKNTAEFAGKIGSGKLDAEFTPLSEQDVLGNSLLEMQRSLNEARQEEEKRKADDLIRQWTTDGFTKFNELLRENSNNLTQLGDTIVANMVSYLKANQAGLFVLNNDDTSDIHLELIAAYAFNRKKYLTKKIELNEGLVGTCAIEKGTIYLTQLPDDYVEITSGLGKSNPNSLLITPLLKDTQILGVLEIASFNEMKKYEIEFIERLGEIIASTIASVKINSRTTRLLEDSQRQAEGLAAQEEEMRQNLEEMQATREEASRKEFEISAILSAIDHTLIRAEFDPSGKLITANSHFLNESEFSLSEVQGKTIETFFDGQNTTDFIAIWQSVKQGLNVEDVVKRKTKFGKEKWWRVNLTPICDEEGNIIKTLYLANDITKQKDYETEITEQSELLKSQEDIIKQDFDNLQNLHETIAKNEAAKNNIINAIDQVFVRLMLNTVGAITETNNTFVRLTGYSNDELIGRKLESLIPEYLIPEQLKLWQNVCNNNTCNYEQNIRKIDGEEIWLLMNYIPVVNELDEVISVSILAADNTVNAQKTIQLKQKLDQLQKQVEIEQTQLLEAANKLKHAEEQLNEHAKNHSESIAVYQNEITAMHNKWSNQLTLAEQKASQNNDSLTALNQKVGTLETKLQQKENEQQKTAVLFDSETEVLYQQWLNHIENITQQNN